jgi:serine protease Do
LQSASHFVEAREEEDTVSALEEIEQAVAAVGSTAAASVVRIGRHGGRGAGLVISPGKVLTSAHNLRGAETTVTFVDGRSETAQVAAVDADGDLAVVSLATADVAPLSWAEPTAEVPRIGAAVFTIGPVPGSGGNRVSVGFVSATGVAFRGPRGRLITDGFEHTAFVGRGSSGGPVLDASGRVVGINTHRPGEGSYLAVPASPTFRARVEALSRGEAPSRRRLGVALAPAHVARRLRSAVGLPEREGVLVRDVGEGSPADAAGLRRGDLIVAIGTITVDSVDALATAMDALGDADTVELKVVRGVEEIAIPVSFGGGSDTEP